MRMMPTPTHHRPRTARYYRKTLCSIADDFSTIFEGRGCRVLGRHACKLMAVPRGFSGGGDRAPSAPAIAAVAADARCMAKGQHAALHDAERDTRCAGSLTAREVAHAERRWRRHGGKTPPRRGSAAAHGGEGTLLAAGPREARSYSSGGSTQRHVESPHLHSQQQTLSTASRVEQA